MADRDRIDTLTANCWSSLYRDDGKVNFDTGMEVIHNAEAYPALMPLLLKYLQQPGRSAELAQSMADLLADMVRDEFASEVQQIIAAEEEEQACWNSISMSCADAQALDERLDDPRREERGAA